MRRKLTKKLIAKIIKAKKLLKEGIHQDKIVKITGLHRGTISNIKNGYIYQKIH